MTALMTAPDVAAMLGVPVSWVYRETRLDRIPHVRVGRYRRYRREAIDAWIASLEQGGTPYRHYSPGTHPGGSRDD
jgi:excisionase family DNA binding protein